MAKFHQDSGLIANLHHHERRFLFTEEYEMARLEQEASLMQHPQFEDDIERMGLIPRSVLNTKEDVKAIEAEFARQDDQCPVVSSLIAHKENLMYYQFAQVVEEDLLDISVELQRWEVSRVPQKLKLTPVNEDPEEEPPVQLLWILKMDELLKEAIASTFHSPFKPAEILQNLRMEFNIMNIKKFRRNLEAINPENIVTLVEEDDWIRSRLLQGTVDYFNEKVASRNDVYSQLAIRFKRPVVK